MEGEYDRDRVSQSFKESADMAASFYRTNLQNGLKDTGAAVKQDELLARLTVYGHLQGRDFLQTRELLLAELRWLLKNERPLTPRQAYNAEHFARWRTKILQSLIDRFEQLGGESASSGGGHPSHRRARG